MAILPRVSSGRNRSGMRTPRRDHPRLKAKWSVRGSFSARARYVRGKRWICNRPDDRRPMDDLRVGLALRAVRVRAGKRQQDVADQCGFARSVISDHERGHIATAQLGDLRQHAAALGVRIDLLPRWKGADLDRLLNSAHSALHESVAVSFARDPAWAHAPEVSFSIFGERGVIDVLAWHAEARALLVVELKTEIVDVQELISNLDRKARLGPRIARERGWDSRSTSRWVIVSDSRTNWRRARTHQAVLASAFPMDGRSMRAWLRRPVGSVSALSFWTDVAGGDASTRLVTVRRVQPRRTRP